MNNNKMLLQLVISWLLVMVFYFGYTAAHAEGKPHKKKHLPPNCMYINGQLRCWVIDPLPTEEEAS
jgi:hypothetical protein